MCIIFGFQLAQSAGCIVDSSRGVLALSRAASIHLEAITANQQANVKVIIAGHPRPSSG